jgi:hypothetical protein
MGKADEGTIPTNKHSLRYQLVHLKDKLPKEVKAAGVDKVAKAKRIHQA